MKDNRKKYYTVLIISLTIIVTTLFPVAAYAAPTDTEYFSGEEEGLLLTFDANGGGKVSEQSKIINTGSKYGELPTVKRAGYKLKGWFTKKSGGKEITKNDVFSHTEDMKIYAQWERKQYKITFKTNGGSSVKKSKKVKYMKAYGKLPEPTRKYYKFAGWYTKKVGGKKVTSKTILSTTGTKTLYAHWKYKINIKNMLAHKNSKCRSGQKLIKFVGVTIHNTSAPQVGQNAIRLAETLQTSRSNQYVSWHYSVDDKRATRSIPENEMAHHCASAVGNINSIGIEICENADGNLREATDRAAALTAQILKRNGIKKAVSEENVFQHVHWYKLTDCPHLIREGKPYDWDTFIKKVNKHLRDDDI